MTVKSNQRKAEDKKTASITKLVALRLKRLKANKGIIEIVNVADNGRVCSMQVSDFRSTRDAGIYAELIRLSPELLYFYLTDAKKIEQVLQRLEKRLSAIQYSSKKLVPKK